MKFLAILKDSLREAIDFKIFSFMVGLSVLIVLFLASFSFRPVSGEEEIRKYAADLNWVYSQRSKAMSDAAQAEQAREEARAKNGKDGKDFQPEMPKQPTRTPALPRVSIEEYKHDGNPAEPWKGDFTFKVLFTFPDPESAKALDAFKNHGEELIHDTLRTSIRWLDEPEVKRLPSDDSSTAVFHVTARSRVNGADDWPYEPAALFGLWDFPSLQMPRMLIISVVMNGIVNSMGAAVALLLSTVVTAFFIPNMLRKGTVDMLVVKPIHRSTLLIYKYLGGMTFMFLNTVIIVLGVYLVVGIRLGYWVNGFLFSIFVLTFEFAVYYAFSTMWGVLTRSPIISILLTCGFWFILWAVGTAFGVLDGMRKLEMPESKKIPQSIYTTVDTIHFVLPRIVDLDQLNKNLVNDSLPGDEVGRLQRKKLMESFNWTENIVISLVFIGVMLGISCWRFTVRDI